MHALILDRWSAPTVNHSTQSWHKTWPYEQVESLSLSCLSNTTKGMHQNRECCKGQVQMYTLQQCSKTTPDTNWASGQDPCLCGSHGKQVEAREVRFCLQHCLAMAGEDDVDLLPHNFRIGAVSEAAGRGASEAQLRMTGGWRSNAYMRYVRLSQRMPLH